MSCWRESGFAIASVVEEIGALIYMCVRQYDEADGPHMIMKASLVNYYAGNYYRAYVSPGQAQTDGRKHRVTGT